MLDPASSFSEKFQSGHVLNVFDDSVGGLLIKTVSFQDLARLAFERAQRPGAVSSHAAKFDVDNLGDKTLLELDLAEVAHRTTSRNGALCG